MNSSCIVKHYFKKNAIFPRNGQMRAFFCVFLGYELHFLIAIAGEESYDERVDGI